MRSLLLFNHSRWSMKTNRIMNQGSEHSHILNCNSKEIPKISSAMKVDPKLTCLPEFEWGLLLLSTQLLPGSGGKLLIALQIPFGHWYRYIYQSPCPSKDVHTTELASEYRLCCQKNQTCDLTLNCSTVAKKTHNCKESYL